MLGLDPSIRPELGLRFAPPENDGEPRGFYPQTFSVTGSASAGR
jgi:hypothetical protein